MLFLDDPGHLQPSVLHSEAEPPLDQLEALAAGVRKLPMLEGWRYEIFGKDALDLVEGKLAFAVEKGRLKMTHIDDVEVAVVQAPVE